MPPRRYAIAAGIALALALFATAFARGSHNTYDLPSYIDVTEWPSVLLFVAAGWAAWDRRERLAAGLVMAALVAFYWVQGLYLFSVPLGFAALTLGTLAFLFVLPTTWKAR